MAERTTVTQLVQIGVESTPGTSVAANRLLPSVSIMPGIAGNMDPVKTSGFKYPTGFTPGKEWTDNDLSGQPTYDELLYLLSSVVASSAGVQQSSTTAYKWLFTSATSSEDTVKTYTVEHGSAFRADKFTYGLVTELALKGNRESVDLSGKMMGQRMSDGITLTSSPVTIDQVPMLPADVSIYLDTTSAGLGTTKLTRDFSWELSIKDRFSPVWVVDSANTSFVAHVERAADVSLKLTMEADSVGMGLLAALRTPATKFIRVQFTSALLAGTAIPYSAKFDIAGQLKSMPGQFGDEDGVLAIGWEFGGVHDPTWGKAYNLELINKRTAY